MKNYFPHNEMISNFPELGKTKPMNSKTRFLMLKPQNIWSDFSQPVLEITFQSCKWREGSCQGSYKGDSLDPLFFGGGGHTLVPFHSSCPSPSVSYPSSPPPPSLFLQLLPQQTGWGRHRHGWKARGEFGENHSRAFLSGLGDERTQWTSTVSHRKIPASVSLQARHWATLNGAGLKFRISDLSMASAWIERLGHGHSCRSESF